jgi:hypothetical protein
LNLFDHVRAESGGTDRHYVASSLIGGVASFVADWSSGFALQ